MLSQAYYCSQCGKFVITFTTHFNEEYPGFFFGCRVMKRDAYCPYCGEKNTSGEMPEMEDLMRGISAEYGILESDEGNGDGEYGAEDEEYSSYDYSVDDRFDTEDADDDGYDVHDWTLPEDDKTVKTFLCNSCGEQFKIGYMDGRRKNVFCPLCGGKGRRE